MFPKNNRGLGLSLSFLLSFLCISISAECYNSCSISCDDCMFCQYMTKENRDITLTKGKDGILHIVEKDVLTFDIPHVDNFKVSQDNKYLFVTYKNTKIQVFEFETMTKIFDFDKTDSLTFTNNNTEPKEFFYLDFSDGTCGVYGGGRPFLNTVLTTFKNSNVYMHSGFLFTFKDGNLIVTNIVTGAVEKLPVSNISFDLKKGVAKGLIEYKDGRIVGIEKRYAGSVLEEFVFVPKK